MSKSIIQDRLQGLNVQVGKQLDRIAGLAPTLPHVNEVAYLTQAAEAARQDPEFRRAFEQALAQYRAVQNAPPGGA